MSASFMSGDGFLPWTPAVLTPEICQKHPLFGAPNTRKVLALSINARGPLCEGDIEEADGVLQVFCPWHDYGYDLRTGKSGTLLQQQVYEVKLVGGDVYVKHASRLSLGPFPANQKN